MLSAQQVKSLLATAVSDHLRKLNRVAALELADGISAAEGRRSDLIMGWALRLRAARGPNATIDSGDHVAILESGLAVAYPKRHFARDTDTSTYKSDDVADRSISMRHPSPTGALASS